MDLCFYFELKMLLFLFYVKPLLILFVCIFIHEKKFSVSASSGIFNKKSQQRMDFIAFYQQHLLRSEKSPFLADVINKHLLVEQ